MKNFIFTTNILSKVNIRYVRFSSLEFFFWSGFAAYYPFLVVFLNSKGFSNTTIGTIIAVNSFIVVLAQPFWGMVSDWLQSVRKVFILCLSTAAILLQSLPMIESALLIGIILAVVTFFESPLNPLLDNWVVQGIRSEKNISYGQVRLWGSFGFSVLVYIYGWIIDKYSINIMFIIFGIVGFLTILVSRTVQVDKPVLKLNLKDLQVGRLFKNFYYVTFIIFSAVLFIPHKSSFTFLPSLIESVSGSKTDLAISYSIMALSEIPVFLFSRKLLTKFKPLNLVLTSIIFFILRQFFYSIASAPIHVILMQVIQGPSFALFLSGALYYVDSIAPDELKATAQTLFASMFLGFSGIIGSYGGGWTIDHLGLHSLYHINILISIVISILFIISLYIGRLVNKP